jgi:hypothetical protein
VPNKVGVILVETNLLPFRQLEISPPRTLGQYALAGFVLPDNLPKGSAFRRGIFRMRVVVVKARTV